MKRTNMKKLTSLITVLAAISMLFPSDAYSIARPIMFVPTGTGLATVSSGTQVSTASLGTAYQFLRTNSAGTGLEWTPGRIRVTKTANYTLTASDGIVVFNGSSLTATLNASPADGETVEIYNINAASLTVSGNGHNIAGASTETLNQWDSRKYTYDSADSIWLRL